MIDAKPEKVLVVDDDMLLRCSIVVFSSASFSVIRLRRTISSASLSLPERTELSSRNASGKLRLSAVIWLKIVEPAGEKIAALACFRIGH